MTAEELERTIELPARAVGLRVETELSAVLVADVLNQPGALPLLSTTVLDLWQRRDGRALRLATYREIGGVSGSVSRLAEAAFERLSVHEQSIASAIFLRLVAFDGHGTMARRPAPLDELDAGGDPIAARVLSILTDSRLVTVDQGTVELAHEVLLREWPRLRDWLQESAESRRLSDHLTRVAREWEAGGMDAAELYRGARLTATLDWAEAHGPELNRVERRFLDESRTASEQEVGRQRRTNRRLRGLLAGVALPLRVFGRRWCAGCRSTQPRRGGSPSGATGSRPRGVRGGSGASG
jgi:hypothetical protein